MKILKQMPQGNYCYAIHMFMDSMTCPDYQESKPPKCLKYNRILSWTISGKVLKCQKCMVNKEAEK